MSLDYNFRANYSRFSAKMELSPSWEVINKKNEAKTARLILEDGSVFEGYLFGACRSSPGEVG